MSRSLGQYLYSRGRYHIISNASIVVNCIILHGCLSQCIFSLWLALPLQYFPAVQLVHSEASVKSLLGEKVPGGQGHLSGAVVMAGQKYPGSQG